jgi:hypothetical protein
VEETPKERGGGKRERSSTGKRSSRAGDRVHPPLSSFSVARWGGGSNAIHLTIYFSVFIRHNSLLPPRSLPPPPPSSSPPSRFDLLRFRFRSLPPPPTPIYWPFTVVCTYKNNSLFLRYYRICCNNIFIKIIYYQIKCFHSCPQVFWSHCDSCRCRAAVYVVCCGRVCCVVVWSCVQGENE